MIKEEARELLQKHIDRQIELYGTFKLPIYDEIIYQTRDDKVGSTILRSFTWIGLIKIAYNNKKTLNYEYRK